MWAVLLCTAYARPYDFNENKQKRQARVNEHGNNKYHVFSEWFWFDRYPLLARHTESIVACVMYWMIETLFFLSAGQINVVYV